ncbi:hypothetical protein RD792_005603 [Penstemon davidsonii]|uniref:Uncharacterized protein n=1 Tax=Penstemon davidsonii TaxID=160366 RepID=A0ABR0DET0_9LAMI|nr:hypothetical protein RD792_005603 [Penstemon davidsonii]
MLYIATQILLSFDHLFPTNENNLRTLCLKFLEYLTNNAFLAGMASTGSYTARRFHIGLFPEFTEKSAIGARLSQEKTCFSRTVGSRSGSIDPLSDRIIQAGGQAGQGARTLGQTSQARDGCAKRTTRGGPTNQPRAGTRCEHGPADQPDRTGTDDSVQVIYRTKISVR